MKVFVAGKSGQVAQALLERGTERGFDMACYGRAELDLTDAASVMAAVRASAPDVVINAAAYTAVDQAESEEDTANLINADAAACLAMAARAEGVPFLHLSTDYVFDGTKAGAYLETDPTCPSGAYGRSKLLGEQRILAQNPDAMIFRTAWVYSATGKNFVKTMLTLALSRDLLGVVADQTGNPTYAADIADALLSIAEKTAGQDLGAFSGLYHLAGTGATSWHDFAKSIFEIGATYGHPVPTVKALTTAEYPTPARRPANSRLDCGKLEKRFGLVLPRWQDSLARCIELLFKNGTVGNTKN